MKRIALISTLLVLTLAGCNNGLSDKDREMLKETHDLAVQAKEAADRAEAEAKAANENALRSAQSADKADRIFREGQNK